MSFFGFVTTLGCHCTLVVLAPMICTVKERAVLTFWASTERPKFTRCFSGETPSASLELLSLSTLEFDPISFSFSFSSESLKIIRVSVFVKIVPQVIVTILCVLLLEACGIPACMASLINLSAAAAERGDFCPDF